MTNSSQTVTASLTLSAFGQTVASSGSSTSAYQFGATSGYRSEGDAGLTLVGCRFYDAQVGRFITRDTYLDQAPYAYCDGDPVNATDPSGHQAPDPTVNHPGRSSGSPTSSGSPKSRDDEPAGGIVPITRGQAHHLVNNLACAMTGAGIGFALGGPIGGVIGAGIGLVAAEAYQTKASGQSLNRMFHSLQL